MSATARRALALALVWTLSHLALWSIFVLAHRGDWSDLNYYVRHTLGVPMTQTMGEYPAPVVWLLYLPTLGGGEVGYRVVFIALMTVCSAAFALALWRWGGAWSRRGWVAALVWSLLHVAIGPLMSMRFDLLPAVLVGAALLALATRPALSGALVALGAGLKLWPAVLLPTLVGRRWSTLGRAVIGFVAVGAALVAGTLAMGGWSRLWSPLAWQGERGLQIESVWASGPMLARLDPTSGVSARFSSFNAFEVFGPGVAAWSTASTIATLAAVCVCGLLLLALWASDRSLTSVTLVVLAVTALIIWTNKTLSPQYLIWLTGPVAVLVAAAATRGERRWAWGLTLGLALVAVLTQCVWPTLYPALSSDTFPVADRLAPTVVLVARNLALTAWTLAAVVAATSHLLGARGRVRRAVDPGSTIEAA